MGTGSRFRKTEPVRQPGADGLVRTPLATRKTVSAILYRVPCTILKGVR
jgi:hypothetical protein